MLIGLAAGVLAALFYGAPSALQARAVRRLPRGPWWQVLRSGAQDPLMLAVIVLYAAGAVANYVAIQLLPLYLAQSAISLEMIFTALVSAWYLGEWPTRHQWTALGGLCLGLGLLAAGSGRPGHTTQHEQFVLALYVGAAACGLAGLALRRLRGHAGGVLLGLLSGTCFAGVPLGARLLRAPYLRPETVASLGAVACFGALGFLFYSLALQRVRVNTASAPLILGQTLLPAGLGIALFGDGVRTGWWWAIVAGMALSIAGTLAVSAAAHPLLEEAAEKVET